MANVYLIEQEIFNSVEETYMEALDCNTDYSCDVVKALSSKAKANEVLDKRVARREVLGHDLLCDVPHKTGKSVRTVILRDNEEDFKKYGYYTFRVLNIIQMEIE